MPGGIPRNGCPRNGRGTYGKPCHNEITRRDKEKHGGARNYHLRRRDAGRVRGLRCFNCNGALRQFRDRAKLILHAFAYLGRNPGAPISDTPQFTLGVFHGDITNPRPHCEPSAT